MYNVRYSAYCNNIVTTSIMRKNFREQFNFLVQNRSMNLFMQRMYLLLIRFTMLLMNVHIERFVHHWNYTECTEQLIKRQCKKIKDNYYF
jgi:hypothetical protein